MAGRYSFARARAQRGRRILLRARVSDFMRQSWGGASFVASVAGLGRSPQDLVGLLSESWQAPISFARVRAMRRAPGPRLERVTILTTYLSEQSP
jgi:hypothetical protein